MTTVTATAYILVAIVWGDYCKINQTTSMTTTMFEDATACNAALSALKDAVKQHVNPASPLPISAYYTASCKPAK